jgi:hypothetical protein
MFNLFLIYLIVFYVYLVGIRQALTPQVSDSSRSLAKFYTYVLHSLYKWLNRRSGRRSYNWREFKEMLGYFQIERLRVRKRVIDADWY